jgi:hypothetical protein
VKEETARPSSSLLLLLELPLPDSQKGNEVISPNTLQELLFLRKTLAEEHSVHVRKTVQVDEEGNVYDLETTEGWILKISVRNNAHATIGVAVRVLSELTARRAELAYIDVRIPSRVFYRFR